MNHDIRQTLNITFVSPYWDEALEQAQAMDAVPYWLTEEFVAEVEKDYAFAGDCISAVMKAREQVVANEALCLFAKVLYGIIGKRKRFSEMFPDITLPEGDENNPGYDFVALFPVLAHLRHSEKELLDRGLTFDILYDTASFLRYAVKSSTERKQRPCYDKSGFSLYTICVYGTQFSIGRLRFEIHPDSNRNAKIFSDNAGNLCTLMHDIMIHRNGNVLGAVGYEDEAGAYNADFVETESYYEGYPVNPETGLAEQKRIQLSKDQWHVVMEPGDALIKVHIPATGKLSPEACEDSFTRAYDIFHRSFPEYGFKGFVCNCWMLCPALRSILKEDSNIIRFQDRFAVFPAKNMAPDVFLYVFGMRVSSAAEVDASALPEENSMQRGVKKLLQEGTYVHQFNGFIPF